MRYFVSIPKFVARYLCISLLCLASVGLKAQGNTLKHCSEDLLAARQSIKEAKRPAQQAVGAFFDPTTQQYRQAFLDWGACVKGHRAPLPGFRTLTGDVFDSTSLAGSIVVVNFWFMGCVPCRAEMPALNKLVDEYKGQRVLFLGFTPDKAATLKPAFFLKNRFAFTIIPDARNIAESFYFLGYPTTYIIDPQGIIREAWSGGYEIDPLSPYYKAKAAIDDLLKTARK
jgi:thiol-disulfide isomerase/thioredoxin